MEAAPAPTAADTDGAEEDEVEVHDPIAGEVVRVVFSERPDNTFFRSPRSLRSRR